MQTQWQVKSSLKFDVLNLLSTLTGDPFYVQYHEDTYNIFNERFTPDVAEVLATLKRIFKDEHGLLVGPLLSLYFSTLADDQSIEQLRSCLKDVIPMRKALSLTPYYDTKTWEIFEYSIPLFTVIFDWLIAIEFSTYYASELLPHINQRVTILRSELEQTQVIPTIETYLGRALSEPTITVYVLAFANPHGIKILGQRYLTDVSYPTEIVISNAVHEMLHPPYLWDDNEEIRAILAPLYNDPFIRTAFDTHNPDYGYNDFPGYIEENVVQALEQQILKVLGISGDPAERWRKSDGGMHVLAVVLFHLMQLESFCADEGGIGNFILRIKHLLQPGTLQAHYSAFMSITPSDKGTG